MSSAAPQRIKHLKSRSVTDTALAISKNNYVNMLSLFIVDPSEAVKKFEQAARSLGESVGERWTGRKRSRDQDSSPKGPGTKSTRCALTPEAPGLSGDEEGDDTLSGHESYRGEPMDDPEA